MIVWPTVFTLLVEAVGLNQGKEKTTCSRMDEEEQVAFPLVAIFRKWELLKKRTEKNLRDNALLL